MIATKPLGIGIPTNGGDCNQKSTWRLQVWGSHYKTSFVPWVGGRSKVKSFLSLHFLWASALGSLNRTASLDLGHCVQLQVRGRQRQASKTWQNLQGNFGALVCVVSCFPDLGMILRMISLKKFQFLINFWLVKKNTLRRKQCDYDDQISRGGKPNLEEKKIPKDKNDGPAFASINKPI